MIAGFSFLALVGLGDFLGQPSWAMVVTGLSLNPCGTMHFVALGMTVWVKVRVLRCGMKVGSLGVTQASLVAALGKRV